MVLLTQLIPCLNLEGSARTRHELCPVACWRPLFRALLPLRDFHTVCAACPFFLSCVKDRGKDLFVTLPNLYSMDLFLLECVEFCLNRNNLFPIISCVRFINVVNGIWRSVSIHVGVNKVLRILKFFAHVFAITQWTACLWHHAEEASQQCPAGHEQSSEGSD